MNFEVYKIPFLYIFLILISYLLKKKKLINKEDKSILSFISSKITIPALIIGSFSSFVWYDSYLIVVLIGLLVNILVLLISLFIARKKSKKDKAMYSLLLPSYNTGSFAFPFIEGIFPAQTMINAMMFDVGNSLYSLGLNNTIAENIVDNSLGVNIKKIFKSLCSSIPLLSYTLMLVLYFLNVKLNNDIYELANTIGKANIVIVMIFFGLILELKTDKNALKESFSILVTRYLINGLFALIVWSINIPLDLKRAVVLILFAPMSSLVVIFCNNLKCREEVYGFVNSVSIIISILIYSLLINM